MNVFGRQKKSEELVLTVISQGNSEINENSQQNAQTTQKQIIAATGLSPRAVKYALKKLKREGIVSENVCFYDLRKKTYRRCSCG